MTPEEFTEIQSKDWTDKKEQVKNEIQSVLKKHANNGVIPYISFDKTESLKGNISPWKIEIVIVGEKASIEYQNSDL